MILLEQKAFELIQEKLQEALGEQGFGAAAPIESESGRAVMFSTGEVAYGLFYETKQKRFVLRREMVKSAKKRRKKDEENNADPQFFLNRLVPIFPELRDEMNEERIVYGQVCPAIFAKEKVAPKCEQLALHYKDSEPMKRLCTVLCEMYGAGDMDTRAVIQFGVLNNIGDAAIQSIIENFTEGCDLQKVYKHSRKLIGKKIKPEKQKKQKKVEARLNG